MTTPISPELAESLRNIDLAEIAADQIADRAEDRSANDWDTLPMTTPPRSIIITTTAAALRDRARDAEDAGDFYRAAHLWAEAGRLHMARPAAENPCEEVEEMLTRAYDCRVAAQVAGEEEPTR